jgi:hypothetical protein
LGYGDAAFNNVQQEMNYGEATLRNVQQGFLATYLCRCRDNNVLYFMNIYSSKRLRVASRQSPPRFPLEQKRREYVEEALVKETVLNVEVESPEQLGVLSVGRGVWITTDFQTQLYRAEDPALAVGKEMQYISSRSLYFRLRERNEK